MPAVAVIGASNDRGKFGNKALRAYAQRGYTVYPVNPNETSIEGYAAYKSITEIPVRPEVVTVYVRPQVLLRILPGIASKGCNELWLNPGTESPEVLAEAERLKINTIPACSIVGLGLSPHDF